MRIRLKRPTTDHDRPEDSSEPSAETARRVSQRDFLKLAALAAGVGLAAQVVTPPTPVFADTQVSGNLEFTNTTTMPQIISDYQSGTIAPALGFYVYQPNGQSPPAYTQIEAMYIDNAGSLRVAHTLDAPGLYGTTMEGSLSLGNNPINDVYQLQGYANQDLPLISFQNLNLVLNNSGYALQLIANTTPQQTVVLTADFAGNLTTVGSLAVIGSASPSIAPPQSALLAVIGAAPPAVAIDGTTATTVAQITGGTGGATTGTSGQTGGAGGRVTVTAGTGGAAPAGSTNGPGGAITLQPGAPGAGAGAAAAYGNLLLAPTGGFVGLGTTTPITIFHTVNTSTVAPRGPLFAQFDNVGGASQLTLRKAAGTPSAPVAISSGNPLGRVRFEGYDGTTYVEGAYAIVAATENWTSTAHGTYFALGSTPNGTTGDLERLRIDQSGNVGIGTMAPQQNLSVEGAANVDQANANNGAPAPGLSFGSASGEAIASKRTTGGNEYGLDFYTASTARMSITNSGAVGIGTTAPGSTLDVAGNIAVAAGDTLRSSADFNNHILPYEVGTGRMALRTGGVDRLSILYTGNVGVGTTTPSYPLDVAGSVAIADNFGGNTNRLYLASGDGNHYLYSSGTNGNQMILGEFGAAFTFLDTSSGATAMSLSGSTRQLRLGGTLIADQSGSYYAQ
jgi:hypothetical protein